ncbi:uncharacterized protein SOCEGT47_046660 [Sorangium cellulosum]|uniref:PE-PGRS family protein n=1 Tax=Sorangium cellulosum TaxID=56 RepID=A0A4P2Q435_SORCE|nr:uncharacterized protein SOCEGT47_046660 [Sorangium cellulosum]
MRCAAAHLRRDDARRWTKSTPPPALEDGLGGPGSTEPASIEGLNAGCSGGPGGKGSNGGGGSGGHSLGIPYRGKPPPSSGFSVETGGPAVAGGGTGAGNGGAAGIKMDTLEFAP